MDSMKLSFVLITVSLVLWLKIGRTTAINGGHISMSNELNYQVSIYVKREYIGGGAIIGEQHILTSAQLFIGEDDKFIDREYTVLAGVSVLNENSRWRVEMIVERISLPSTFEYNQNPNGHSTGDIAVLKLRRSFDFGGNPKLNQLNLPTSRSDDYPTAELIVSGFGNAEVANAPLKFAHTNIVDNAKCERQHQNPIKQYVFCASVIQRGSQIAGTTKGDRGGPLVLNSRFIIGLLIGGPLNGNEQTAPGIYTRVYDYLEFINRAIVELRSYEIRFAEYVRVRSGCCKKVRMLAEGTSA